MKRLIIILFAIIALPLSAQTRREALLQYQANRQKALTEYSTNYRNACVEFMRQRWEAFNVEAPVAMPERKEPVEPVVKPTATDVKPTTPSQAVTTPAEPVKPTAEPQPKPATEGKPLPEKVQPKTPSATPLRPAVTPDAVASTPKPKAPIAPTTSNPSHSFKFTFYGTECSVPFNSTHTINLSSISENAVATAWQSIASGKFDPISAECKKLSKQLNLNDWGYYSLVRTVADTRYGENSNKSLLLQSFLLSEAGFKMRLARGDGRLWILLCVEQKVYSRPYFRIDNDVFYLLDGQNKASRYEVCNFSIPGERALSLKLKELPRLAHQAGNAIKRLDKSQNIELSVSVNTNLMAFMQDYPPCDWHVYASAQLSESTANVIMTTLRQAIQGKSTTDATQILLTFIHNAFPYKADAQQFGRERTLFAEEMFAYKYSDCEDRSILFALLVRSLLNLDVILLHYPEHIATAVYFGDGASGDSVQFNRKSYLICDPTYVGADIGEAMPEYRNISAKIVKIE